MLSSAIELFLPIALTLVGIIYLRIKEAKKKINGEDKKISSPYTIEHKDKPMIPPYIIIILICLKH